MRPAEVVLYCTHNYCYHENGIGSILIITILASCKTATRPSETGLPITGTWELLSGTLIQKNDTTVTDYTKNRSFIKIINDSHFAFLLHDVNKGKDSSSTLFSAGGGSYSLQDSLYTERLEYCSDRQWEGHEFHFTISIRNDTLIQKGEEKIEQLGVSRINIEKYARVKSRN